MRRRIAHEVHLALQLQAHTMLPRPPQPIPTYSDDGRRPSSGMRWDGYNSDLQKLKAEYFCFWGLTISANRKLIFSAPVGLSLLAPPHGEEARSASRTMWPVVQPSTTRARARSSQDEVWRGPARCETAADGTVCNSPKLLPASCRLKRMPLKTKSPARGRAFHHNYYAAITPAAAAPGRRPDRDAGAACRRAARPRCAGRSAPAPIHGSASCR